MATETTLAKVNVFSTRALYDENVDSLGEDEISLVPVDEIALPVGTVIAMAANSAPDGYLLCNGATVSRSTYATLFAAIGTTYGTGDGSTTFNLPNLNNNSFLEGSNTAGTVKSAGLPNITGSIRKYESSSSSVEFLSDSTNLQCKGALDLEYGDQQSTSSYDEIAQRPQGMTFDASKSNAIYGNSDTVQPKSVTVKFCIKY